MRAKAIRAIFSVLVLASMGVPALAQQGKQLPFFDHVMRFNAGEVDVNVTVTDSRGKFVSGLRRGDFRVFDNGVEQPVTSFAPNTEPSHVVVLVETGAEDYLLAKVGRGLFADAAEFVKGIYSVDQVAVVTYSDRAYVAMDFASSGSPAEVALGELNAELLHGAAGSSALALSSSLAAVIYWLRGVRGKKAIVLISTGIDVSPPEEQKFVEEELQVSDVPVMAVSAFGDFRKLPPRRRLSSSARDQQAFVKKGMTEFDGWLSRLAEASSGHAYFPSDAKEFQAAFARITQLVRGEYGVGFAPPSLDGKRHTITVKVSHPWYRRLHVDYRHAYVAGAAER